MGEGQGHDKNVKKLLDYDTWPYSFTDFRANVKDRSMQIAPEYFHCIILSTQNITIFSIKNVKVIDAQKVKFYKKNEKFAKKMCSQLWRKFYWSISHTFVMEDRHMYGNDAQINRFMIDAIVTSQEAFF